MCRSFNLCYDHRTSNTWGSISCNVFCQGMLETPICALIGGVGEFARLWTPITHPSQVQIHTCHTNLSISLHILQFKALNLPFVSLRNFGSVWENRPVSILRRCCAEGCSQWKQESIDRRSHCWHLCVCLPCQQIFPRYSLLLPMEEDEQHLRSQTLRFLNCLFFKEKP